MSGFELIAEGPLPTGRLRLHHIRTMPTRPPSGRLLMLGGSNFDLRLKRAFLSSRLCDHFELVAYEPRGIGRTEQPSRPWRMADYARDALACLDALGWERAHIVGESFGGMTALHLALSDPERVDRMALASATAGGGCGASYDIGAFLALPRRDAAEAALVLQDAEYAEIKHTDPDAYRAALADRIAFEDAFETPSVTSGGYAALLAARRGHDVCDQLGRIDAPTLVCAGLRDKQAPPDAQERMAAALRNASFAAFDAGHGVLFNNAATTELVLDHLSGGDAARK